jgi:hypothetical protein
MANGGGVREKPPLTTFLGLRQLAVVVAEVRNPERRGTAAEVSVTLNFLCFFAALAAVRPPLAFGSLVFCARHRA